MRVLQSVDLGQDPAAARYVKDEVVTVAFAPADGALTSRVGPNRYVRGDALVTGSDGDTWSVTRAVFDTKYRAEPGTAPGADGAYRNVPSPVYARRFDEAFSIARRSGDVLTGRAGDWLLQYGAGDYGVADAARFARVYRRLPS